MPITVAPDAMIISTLADAMESSQITRPTINQITVTLTDEHGNGIDAFGAEVNLVLLFQYYRIPVLQKPLKDVRSRLRYIRAHMLNKNKSNSKNDKKSSSREKKARKEKGGRQKKAKANGLQSNKLIPVTQLLPSQRGAQP